MSDMNVLKEIADAAVDGAVEAGSLMSPEGVLTDLGEAVVRFGLETLGVAAHRQAETAGWNENRNTVLEELMLVTTEVAEAAEEARDGCPGIDGLYYDSETQKPEGIASELGDVIIRSAHMASNPQHGFIDVVEGTIAKLRYNPTRAHRHGGRLA